jgi:hypothetical protein
LRRPEKDLADATTLLIDHELTRDGEGIDLRYLVDLTRQDWPLWRTTTMIADRTAVYASKLGVPAIEQRTSLQVKALHAAFDAAPKSVAWRARAKLGDRKTWYRLPEDVRENQAPAGPREPGPPNHALPYYLWRRNRRPPSIASLTKPVGGT